MLGIFNLFAIAICILLKFSLITALKYNVSLAQMATCKEYHLRSSGYTYLDFFHVHTMDNNKLRTGERLHLKFYVVTAMDAHILLSVSNHPRLMDRVYEIVIGAGGNTFSAIRTSMGRRRVATNQDPHLLSIFDPTPIEIVQMQDGNLLVHIPGFKDEPLMNFTDASPLTINYVSFSAFGTISARWFYDCQFDGFDAEMQQEERPLTPLQRLITNVTAKGQNKLLPQDLKQVNFAFQICSLVFKQDTSILKTRMHLILYWNDPALQWNPEDFNGIDTIFQPSLDIWTPKILVLNGALETFSDFKPSYDIKVQANGTVILFTANAEFNTWCSNRNPNWPQENVDCEVELGIHEMSASQDTNIELSYDATTPFSGDPVSTLSEWIFIKIAVTSLERGNVDRYTERGILQSTQGDVSIDFTIARNGEFYRNVFTMPVLACESLILLSFLLRGYRRGALILVCVIVICLGLMFITRHAPPSYVPDIMFAYQNILRVVTFCYLLHIVIMWLQMFPPKEKPCDYIMKAVVNSSTLRFVLCMRYSDASEYVAIQERPWNEIAKMLNSICFLLTNIIFILIDVFLLPKSSN